MEPAQKKVKRRQLEESQFSYKSSRLADDMGSSPIAASSRMSSTVPKKPEHSLSKDSIAMLRDEVCGLNKSNQEVVSIDQLLAEKSIHEVKWSDISKLGIDRMSLGPFHQMSVPKETENDEIVGLKGELDQLTVSDITEMMRVLRPTLRGVFSGEISSDRHQPQSCWMGEFLICDKN